MKTLQTMTDLDSPQRNSSFSRRRFMLAGLGIAAFTLAGCNTGNVANQQASQSSVAEVSNGSGDGAESVSELPPAPKKDHPAPDFTLATLDGGELNLADLRGKPVILNFWASWCGPCRLEMPHLQEVHVEQQDELVVLGINLTQRENNMDDIPDFVDEFGLSFPIVLDEDGDVAKLYEVRGQPASIFIDANGIVSTVFYGPVTKSFIEDRIAEISSL